MQIIKPILLTIITSVVILLVYYVMNIGWYGYEKWKPRRSTFGNRSESIERKVFIKDLSYSSSIDIDSFSIYIEKGFRYGYHSSHDTRSLENAQYPFQITFTDRIGKNNINYYISDKLRMYSIDCYVDGLNIHLKKPFLKDTLRIGISKFDNPTQEWDSIGLIKVYDR